LASRQKQLSLLRAPKLWPSQTVEMLLPLMAMAVKDPHSAEVAAVVRASIEYAGSNPWTVGGVATPQSSRRPEANLPLAEQDAEDANSVNYMGKSSKRA
jgi:hypothetical protein